MSRSPARYRHSWWSIAIAVALGLEASAALAAPLATILAPSPRTKLRQGRTAPVVITARGSASLTWTLSLKGPDGASVIASGLSEITAEAVTELKAAALAPGELYELHLMVTEGGVDAVATSSVMVPDTRFRVIPLSDGDGTGYGVDPTIDHSGHSLLYSSGSGSLAPLTIIRRGSPVRQTMFVDLGSTSGVKLSGDGRRVFLESWLNHSLGMGYIDIASQVGRLISTTAASYFSVDYTGRRMAYQESLEREDPRVPNLQYFLFDEETEERRQLTDEPGTINFYGGDCPSRAGSTPQISADGSTVVFITPATLGFAPPDPDVGCRIFAYDVATQEMRQVAALPSTWYKMSYPSLSDDGRWLSFPAVILRPTGGSRGVPVLVDIETGEVTAPIVDSGNFTNFDSVITRDGSTVIISSQADLDSRVGNADHNLELFSVNRTTGEINQITETIGGIASTPGGCPTFHPSASANGDHVAFGLVAISVESCHIDGPQLIEENGLWLGYVHAVRKRPGNREPTFPQVAEQGVVAGERFTFVFTAEDPDADPVSFYAQVPGTRELLPGSWFEDHFDGTATLEWPTRLENTGTHVLRVAAFDEGGGEVVQDVIITVAPAGAAEPCAGACTEAQNVSVDDVVILINIALGMSSAENCPPGDIDDDGNVTVDEITAALDNALNGCGGVARQFRFAASTEALRSDLPRKAGCG